WLTRRRVHYTGYPDPGAALSALAAGAIDAVVYEAPILTYLAHEDLKDAVTVLPGTFEHHGYGFGLPEGSALREPLNRALLAVIQSDDWAAVTERYLGP